MRPRGVAIFCVAVAALAAGPVVRAFASSPALRVAACPLAARHVDVRATIPAGFPLPAGVAFTWIERRRPETMVVGISPWSLAATANFFRTALAKIGTRSTWADAEFGESEARFSGPALSGRWRVNVIAGCAGASVVSLSFPTRVRPGGSMPVAGAMPGDVLGPGANAR